MEMQPYIVYVRTDGNSRIIAINSSAFLDNTAGWVEIDSGYGDRYHHAQGNYFDKTIYDDRGICQYKLVKGKPEERTKAEMDADYIPTEPEPADTNEARIAALEAAMAAIEEGIASV